MREKQNQTMQVELIMIKQLLAIIAVLTKGSNTCNIDVCVTWFASTEEITLKCKVNALKWKVEFINPLKQSLAWCVPPFPKPLCLNFQNNGSIHQDTMTNVTEFTIKGHIDSSLNGEWTCFHGSNIDKAIVNVTVIKEVSRNFLSCPVDESDCKEAFMAFTLIGIVAIRFVVIIGQCMFDVYHQYNCDALSACTFLKNKRRQLKPKVKKLYTNIFGLIVLIAIVVIPLGVGVLYKDCKGKYYFLVMSVLTEMFIFLFFYQVKEKVAQRPNIDQETESAQRNFLQETTSDNSNIPMEELII